MSKLRVAVLYGSRSTEHEVSIITALQVMENLDPGKYEILPIYISKTGRWIKGDSSLLKPDTYKNLDQIESKLPNLLINPQSSLSQTSALSRALPLPKIDIVFPAFHGTFGEDGTIQGLLEMANLPYVGCGILASSIGMDKLIQKMVFAAAGLPQVKSNQTGTGLKYPLFVKPANGGSSIGITKVKDVQELKEAIKVAQCYDRKMVIEESAEGFSEINISVLGNTGGELKTSVCEKPVPSKEVLTYDDKYKSGGKGMAGAKRLIPAPIKPATAAKIAEYAKTAFEAIDGSGMARVDFLVSPDEKTIYINEINTIPGSLAFYLWEASGLKFSQLLDELIRLALEKYSTNSHLIHTFSTNILANLGNTLKGGKLKS